MLERSAAWIEALKNGADPVMLLLLTTDAGLRVYGKSMPADDMLGSAVDWDAAVTSFGKIRSTLTPIRGKILQSLKQTELPSTTVSLANAEKKMSKLAATESLLSASGKVAATFKGLSTDDFVVPFEGLVHKITISESDVKLHFRGE